MPLAKRHETMIFRQLEDVLQSIFNCKNDIGNSEPEEFHVK
jgi:hypothetical protein